MNILYEWLIALSIGMRRVQSEYSKEKPYCMMYEVGKGL